MNVDIPLNYKDLKKMYAKFAKQTKRVLFPFIVLIILYGLFAYHSLWYISTQVKYETTSSAGRFDVKINNSGKQLNNKYKKAEDESVLQNESATIVVNHGTKNGQTYLGNKEDIHFSETKSHPSYTKLLSFTRKSRENMELVDIMGLPPIKFDPAYKNPCFMGDKTNQLFNDGKLHCLPYFYLIGVKKSGTSDLFNRISAHPEFKEPGFKESQWFPRMQFGISSAVFYANPIFKKILNKGIDNRNIKFYISLFDGAAAKIHSQTTKNKNGSVYHKCITAEATPANYHMHTNWDILPGNEGLTEPRYTNFHYIKHLMPDAKIIIIMRDPVTRLFSDFKHGLKIGHIPAYKEMSRDFHENVTVLIQAYESCFRRFPMRRCIYNDTLLNKENMMLKESFRAGFYAFFWEELLSVFRRDQIFAVHTTRYVTNTGDTLANIFKFLNMSPLSREKLSNIVRLNVHNKSKMKQQMYQETQDMLYKFYKPYNERMAELMNDNAHLFPQS